MANLWNAWPFVLLCLLYAATRWWVYREEAKRRADLLRYSGWTCPTCSRMYGDTVRYTQYGADQTINFPDGPFIPHVILTCSHCGQLNCFNRKGSNRPALSISPEMLGST